MKNKAFLAVLAFFGCAEAQAQVNPFVPDFAFCATRGAIAVRAATAWQCLLPGTSGYVLRTNGAGADPSWAAVSGTGTVTSVALSAPTFLSVSGSPITGAGTLTLSLASQSQNRVFASPDGASGVPSFRALVSADLPVVGVDKGGTGQTAGGGAALDAVSALATLGAVQRTGVGTYTAGILPVSSGGTGQSVGSGTALDAISGFSGATAGALVRTGAGTWAVGTLSETRGGTGQTSYTAGNILFATNSTTLSKLTIGAAGTHLRSSGTAPSWQSIVPDIQVLTSSGTYTTPANAAYLEIEMIGGGAGGAGSGAGATSGGTGGATTFGASLLSAGGGTVFGQPDPSATGGYINLAGAQGQGGSTLANSIGPMGAASQFGGGGAGAQQNGSGGYARVFGAGGGGGGGCASSCAASSGGGSGAYLRAIISAPAASYSYSVGSGGSGGSAGTGGGSGGAGGNGTIIVKAYF